MRVLTSFSSHEDVVLLDEEGVTCNYCILDRHKLMRAAEPALSEAHAKKQLLATSS